jgi:hydrogenase expression/formation protein HypC
MCLAVPSRVLECDGFTATVEAFGERRTVSLLLLDEPVRPGDYVLVQAGGHAFERVDPERARQALAVLRELMREDGADVRAW